MWTDNLLDGYGTYSWPDGMRYEGYFEKDKKNGFGHLFYPDGRRYEGKFKNNKHHGQATMFFPDGSSKVGIWTNGDLKEWLDYTEIKYVNHNVDAKKTKKLQISSSNHKNGPRKSFNER
jgi:hypothetical protein